MQNIVIKIILTFIIAGSLISLTTIVIAEGEEPTSDYELLVGLPGIPAGSETDLGDYLSNMFKILIGVAGVLAVVMIIIGGVMYMTVESISGKGEAKKKINNAIFGLILALSSYLLLNTIDTNLVTGSLSLKPVPAPPTTQPISTTPKFTGTCLYFDESGSPIKRDGNKYLLGITFGDTKEECLQKCDDICSASEKCATVGKVCKEKDVENKWGGMCVCYNKEPEDFKVKKNVQGSSPEKCMESCESLCREAGTTHFNVPCAEIN